MLTTDMIIQFATALILILKLFGNTGDATDVGSSDEAETDNNE